MDGKMDRKIGLGMIILWSLSTIGNVIVEVMGYGGDLKLRAHGQVYQEIHAWALKVSRETTKHTYAG